jgi:hypothetical protein
MVIFYEPNSPVSDVRLSIADRLVDLMLIDPVGKWKNFIWARFDVT